MLGDLVTILVLNSIVALSLALLAEWVGNRRPALAHALYLCALIKLITPPFVDLEILPGHESVKDQRAKPAHPPHESLRELPLVNVAIQDLDPSDDLIISANGHVDTAPTLTSMVFEHASTAPAPDALSSPLAPESIPASRELSRDKTSFQTLNSGAPSELGPMEGFMSALPLALGLWGLGSIWMGIYLAKRYRMAQRFVQKGLDPPDPLLHEVSQIAKDFGLKTPPSTRLVPAILSPMVLSLFSRPKLILPQSLVHTMNDGQRSALIAHEMAHLKRRDHWVRHLEAFALMVLWWHPLTWWVKGRLHRYEEACCDAWVVAKAPNLRKPYALALIETLDFLNQAQTVAPPLSSAFRPVNPIKRRLTMILNPMRVSRSLSPMGRTCLAALVLVLVPWLPSTSQDVVAKEQSREGETVTISIDDVAKKETQKTEKTRSEAEESTADELEEIRSGRARVRGSRRGSGVGGGGRLGGGSGRGSQRTNRSIGRSGSGGGDSPTVESAWELSGDANTTFGSNRGPLDEARPNTQSQRGRRGSARSSGRSNISSTTIGGAFGDGGRTHVVEASTAQADLLARCQTFLRTANQPLVSMHATGNRAKMSFEQVESGNQSLAQLIAKIDSAGLLMTEAQLEKTPLSLAEGPAIMHITVIANPGVSSDHRGSGRSSEASLSRAHRQIKELTLEVTRLKNEIQRMTAEKNKDARTTRGLSSEFVDSDSIKEAAGAAGSRGR